ncbi:transcription factor IIA subunit alpha [Fusarium solani]
MSNQAVGNVYQTIIDEVINSSRVDFEESGIEESVLEELRQGWQRKLTQLDVARFPWDPKPDPPPPAQPAPPPTSAAPTHAQAQFSPQLNVPVPQGLSLPGVNPPPSSAPEWCQARCPLCEDGGTCYQAGAWSARQPYALPGIQQHE